MFLSDGRMSQRRSLWGGRRQPNCKKKYSEQQAQKGKKNGGWSGAEKKAQVSRKKKKYQPQLAPPERNSASMKPARI